MKTMKHNKIGDTLLFLLSLTKSQVEKTLKENSLYVQVLKKVRNSGSENTLPQYLPNTKNKFLAKCILT